jgi:predicted ATPase
MLKKLKLENFKSFAQAEVELAPLTFLVGANASGKSNFIDALRVSKGFALGMKLREVLEGRRVGDTLTWGGIRGGLAEVTFAGAPKFAIEGKWIVADPVFDPKTNEPARPGSRAVVQRIEAEPGPPLLSRVVGPDDEDDWLTPALQEIGFFDPHASRMRGLGTDGPLGIEGENLSGLLESMFKESGRKAAIVQWLRELCAPEIEDLDFIRVPELRQVMLAIVEKNGLKISARSLSDGTLRFLYLLVVLRLLHPAPLVVTEEIETGLHPTRLGKLVEVLEGVAREGRTQIIATTHSPTLLEWLAPETLDSVVLCARVPGQPGTILRRLGDLPHFREVVERKSFHELFATGWLEMAV